MRGSERSILERYRPNETFYLPESVRAHLRKMGSVLKEQRPAGTYARDILNRLLIDLSWASSRHRFQHLHDFEPACGSLGQPPFGSEREWADTKAKTTLDAFEQAFFIMVHIPYLQPFVDVPEAAYVEGTLGIYELRQVELLRDVFVWAYERSCQRYTVIKDRPSMGPGAAHDVWFLAK